MASIEEDPGPGPRPHEPVGGDPGPGLFRSSWRGARRGFRWVAYVAGPLAAVPLTLGLALMALGLGTGHGLGVPTLIPGAIRFYLVCGLWGAIIGAILGLVLGSIRKAPPGSRIASWWAAANRPIRPFRKDPSPPAIAPAPRTPRRGRRILWAGVSLLLLLVAAAGTGTYLARVVDRRLEAAIARADRDDPSWRWDDLMADRDPVPDEENSALVVAEALSLLPGDWPSGPPRRPGGPWAAPTEASKAYEAADQTAENVPLDDPVAGTLRNELETYREAVAIARTLAGYARGRHELEPGPTLIDTPLPETQATRTAARLLSVDAAVRAHDGDFDGALDSCRAILGVGRSIGDEPFSISQLVRIAVGCVATQSARRVLAQGEPADEALARLQGLLLDEMDQPLLLRGMRGERAMLTELIRRIAEGEMPISALSGGRTPPDLGRPTAIAPWGRLMFENQLAVGLDWMNEAVAIARLPAASRPPLLDRWEANIQRVRKSWHSAYTSTIPVLMSPAIAASSWANARYQAELGATAILLAAERYRLRSGDWPSTIDAIGPEILPRPPLDPFSGRPFLTTRRDGRFLVYSAGPDRKDGRGVFDPKKWPKGKTDDVGAAGWDVPRRRESRPGGEGPPGSTRLP